MNNPLHERQWTQRGRVVYNRKPHRWRTSDVLRIASAAAIQRIVVGKELFKQLRRVALRGVELVEDVQEGLGLSPKSLRTIDMDERKFFIIEEIE